MRFEWDPDKRQANVRKHGVDFAEAMTVFGDRLEKTIRDPDHSTGEERFVSLGESETGRLLVVSYTERPGDRIRIIGARPATPRERRDHERTG